MVGAYAASPAFDHGPSAPYQNGWQTGDNGGGGFSAWSLTATNGNGNTGGFFVGNPVGNGGRGNIGSDSWGMYANSGDQALALRLFNIGGPNNSAILAPNQSFGIAMDNGSVATNSTVGFNLLNAAGVDRFTFEFIGGGTNYVYDLGNGVKVDTGVPLTLGGLQLTFALG